MTFVVASALIDKCHSIIKWACMECVGEACREESISRTDENSRIISLL